jgi:hypothetical protein
LKEEGEEQIEEKNSHHTHHKPTRQRIEDLTMKMAKNKAMNRTEQVEIF